MQLLSLKLPKKHCSVISLVLALGLGFSSLGALAQGPGGPGGPDDSGFSLALGVAGMSSQKAYQGIDRDNLLLPMIHFENQYIGLFGPNIEFKLPGFELGEAHEFNFSLLGHYDFGGYGKDEIRDTPILNGMAERKGGFWAGAKLDWSNPLVDVSAEWLADTSGHSDGQRFSLTLERSWFFGHRFMLTPRMTASWLDDDYVNYHYGVRANEVRPDRPAYTGEAAINIEYGVRGIYMFNMQHSLFLDAGVTYLADEIKRSPLIGRSSENTLFFGYMYRFR